MGTDRDVDSLETDAILYVPRRELSLRTGEAVESSCAVPRFRTL